MFAEDYSRFMEVSDLDPQPDRLQARVEAMFEGNRDIFDGARVLDLACHDGRFAFAALQAGASHVVGLEVREELVAKARDTFAFYGQDPATYEFVCGDVFEVLARRRFEVDVVLCLGFLYHTYRHTELMYRVHQMAPRHLVLDTMVVLDTRPVLKVLLERDTGDIRSAGLDEFAVGRVLVARPSVPALELLLAAYGFEIESAYDWKGRLAGAPPPPGLKGYASGKRVTVRCRARGVEATAGSLRVAARQVQDPVARQGASSPGWRERLNHALARATGYELRRVPSER